MVTSYPTTWDRQAQRLHITVGKGGPPKDLTEVHPSLYLERDAAGHLVGIEVLGPAAVALYQEIMWRP